MISIFVNDPKNLLIAVGEYCEVQFIWNGNYCCLFIALSQKSICWYKINILWGNGFIEISDVQWHQCQFNW